MPQTGLLRHCLHENCRVRGACILNNKMRFPEKKKKKQVLHHTQLTVPLFTNRLEGSHWCLGYVTFLLKDKESKSRKVEYMGDDYCFFFFFFQTGSDKVAVASGNTARARFQWMLRGRSGELFYAEDWTLMEPHQTHRKGEGLLLCSFVELVSCF